MRERRRFRGARIQHYYVSPVRYTLSAGGTDSEVWGARLVGLVFIALSVLLLETPVRETLGATIQAVFGAQGISVLAGLAAEHWQNWLVGGVLLTAGLGIVTGWRLAYFAGVALSVAMLPFVPFGTGGGIVMGFVLWNAYRAAKWSPGIWSRVIPELPPELQSTDNAEALSGSERDSPG